MRRITLWLKKDNDESYFIKDFADLDDKHHKDRFNGRTFSDADKFETGQFLTDDELEAIVEKPLFSKQ